MVFQSMETNFLPGFADDVTIIAQDLEELEIGLNELSVASMQHGLQTNMAKSTSQ